MPQDEYNKKFDVDNAESDKLKAAFAQVSDIRKFEIELYWKRATYFWALIAVAFAGYFSILSTDQHMPNKLYLSMVVASIGFVFTFAWYLANRGSKYWQENWENHLDLLEDAVTGPLYKTLLERPEHASLVEMLITGPLSISVSKINQWVSVFVIFIWVVLVAFSAYKSLSPLNISTDQWFIITAHAIVLIVAIACCVFMVWKGKTHKKEHIPNVKYRVTKIGKRL